MNLQAIRKSVRAPRVPPCCGCDKPLDKGEIITDGSGACWHLDCGGYICTEGRDCFPGCPHQKETKDG